MSRGEKQRVAIARAFINEAPLVLASEPTGNLDSVPGQDVVMALHDVARDDGRSEVIVIHDQRVEEIADRIHGWRTAASATESRGSRLGGGPGLWYARGPVDGDPSGECGRAGVRVLHLPVSRPVRGESARLPRT